MDLKLLYALILTIMPVTELRVGLPLAILYAIENNISIALIFSLVLLLNILVIFFIFYFLDNLHHIFMNSEYYRRIFEAYLKRFRKRVDKFEKKHESLGFLALILFVAVPLPGTGAWTGCLVSWLLGLNRKKSILSIAIGVTIAGILILLGTLGFISLI
ncbi:putative small multi-drug export protein [archaeon BMS3Abin17]|nr:putative small multi-drug export protein [archaeon BMS3Abin17]HDZ61031.1 ligand-binding protein SH3 [Candidatus Pacearchaeota archaeon]